MWSKYAFPVPIRFFPQESEKNKGVEKTLIDDVDGKQCKNYWCFEIILFWKKMRIENWKPKVKLDNILGFFLKNFKFFIFFANHVDHVVLIYSLLFFFFQYRLLLFGLFFGYLSFGCFFRGFIDEIGLPRIHTNQPTNHWSCLKYFWVSYYRLYSCKYSWKKTFIFAVWKQFSLFLSLIVCWWKWKKLN